MCVFYLTNLSRLFVHRCCCLCALFAALLEAVCWGVVQEAPVDLQHCVTLDGGVLFGKKIFLKRQIDFAWSQLSPNQFPISDFGPRFLNLRPRSLHLSPSRNIFLSNRTTISTIANHWGIIITTVIIYSNSSNNASSFSILRHRSGSLSMTLGAR